MAVVDPEFAELKRQVAGLQVEMAELRKTTSWWHQFSATALPIIITIVIAVWAGITTQNSRFQDVTSRFESVERRIENIERRIEKVEQNQVEMNQRLARSEESLRRLEQERR
jgi:prefoldin subunit 5